MSEGKPNVAAVSLTLILAGYRRTIAIHVVKSTLKLKLRPTASKRGDITKDGTLSWRFLTVLTKRTQGLREIPGTTRYSSDPLWHETWPA